MHIFILGISSLLNLLAANCPEIHNYTLYPLHSNTA